MGLFFFSDIFYFVSSSKKKKKSDMWLDKDLTIEDENKSIQI